MTTKLSKYMLAAMAALMTLMVTSAAYAQSASPEVAKAENARWYALAAALGLGIAAFGGALGQGGLIPIGAATLPFDQGTG